MRINVIIPSTMLGGGVRVAFLYANELVKKGHDVVFYLPMIFSWKDINYGRINWKTTIGNTIKRGTKVDWFECNFPIKRVPWIKDAFIRDADITIATAWYTARNVANLKKSKGEKVYFIQDYEVGENEINRGKVEASYLLINNRITIASWLNIKVKEVTGCDTFILQNGVLDNEYIKQEKVRNKKKTIIMLGNNAIHKGGETGIKVLKRICEKFDVNVIIYSAKHLSGLPDSFKFYYQPERSKLMELYDSADICLFPSVAEGWGLIVTEAMAHKCAVVGNPTGALGEIGINGVNSLFSDGPSEKSLYSSLVKLLNDEELMIHIQNNGYKTVSNMKFSYQSEKLEKYLMSLIV